MSLQKIVIQGFDKTKKFCNQCGKELKDSENYC